MVNDSFVEELEKVASSQGEEPFYMKPVHPLLMAAVGAPSGEFVAKELGAPRSGRILGALGGAAIWGALGVLARKRHAQLKEIQRRKSFPPSKKQQIMGT